MIQRSFPKGTDLTFIARFDIPDEGGTLEKTEKNGEVVKVLVRDNRGRLVATLYHK